MSSSVCTGVSAECRFNWFMSLQWQMLLTSTEQKSRAKNPSGSLAHPSCVPYRYHKYVINHIHAMYCYVIYIINIRHYTLLIWRDGETHLGLYCMSRDFALPCQYIFKSMHGWFVGAVVQDIWTLLYLVLSTSKPLLAWPESAGASAASHGAVRGRSLARASWKMLGGTDFGEWNAQYFPWHSDVWSFWSRMSRCMWHVGSGNGSPLFVSTLIVQLQHACPCLCALGLGLIKCP